MARILTNPLMAARQILRSDRGWLLFLEVALAGDQYIRLVQNEQHLMADGRAWQACPINLEGISEDEDGTLGDIRFTVPNVSREALRLVETDQILGRPIIAWLQYAGSLDTFEAALSWRHTIISATADEMQATFECGHAAELHKCPGPLFDRKRFRQLQPGVGVRLI
jgi:hypothetical protein